MVSVYTMSPQYIAMSAYDGFSHFVNNQPASAASTSGNSSESTSPPCLRLGEMQPTLADTPHQSNALRDDDALVDDDILDVCLQSNADSKSQSNFHSYGKDQSKLLGGHGSKLKATTAERRATHNAIERARRESLNGRFLELARALPTMSNVKRPSKSVIVNKSLEWICESQVREYELARENAFLRNHVNELRAQLRMESLPLNLALINPSQVPHKFAGAHSPQATSGVDSTMGFISAGPRPPQCHQSMTAQHSHGYGSKQRPLAANVHEGHSTRPNPAGDHCKSMTGPFSTPHPQGQRNYLASNLYESSDGSDKTIEQLKLPNSQSFVPAHNDENISSIYFPGLSIHTDSNSPFQALSESDGLLSTAGSSPPRLRYFSSSGSSDASDQSPSHLDHPNAAPHFETERKPFNNEVSSDRLNSGAIQVGALGGSVTPINHQSGLAINSEIGAGIGGTVHAPNMDVTTKLRCSPTDFDTHSLSAQRHSVQFPPSNYGGSLPASSELFENPQSLPQVPRGSLTGGTSIDSSMMAISPAVNPGGVNESSTGFPIGAAWVWG